MNTEGMQLVDLLRIMAAGDVTVTRARELESLIARDFPSEPKFEDLELALAKYSPAGGPGLIREEGLTRVCQVTLRKLGGCPAFERRLFMPPEDAPTLVLPNDFDDYAWEVESKGVFWEARMRYKSHEYPLTFYDPTRLAQDVTAELRIKPLFFERNLVVVDKVTKAAMDLAVQELVREGRLTGRLGGDSR